MINWPSPNYLNLLIEYKRRRAVALIYLDQNTLSNLAKEKQPPVYQDLKRLLRKGADSAILACPRDFETRRGESIEVPGLWTKIDRLLSSISRGLDFQPSPRRLERELLFSGAFPNYNELTEAYRAQPWKLFLNDDPDRQRQSDPGIHAFNFIIHVDSPITDFEASLKLRARQRFENTIAPAFQRERSNGLPLRKQTEINIDAYFKVHSELWDYPILQELIRTYSNNARYVPSAWIHNYLSAYLNRPTVKGRPPEYGDHYDLMGLSAALPYCDVAILDSEMVEMVRQTKLDVQTRCKCVAGGSSAAISAISEILKPLAPPLECHLPSSSE